MPLYTRTEKRLMDVLSDGMPHHKEELWACIDDELSGENTLRVHMTNLRNKLRPAGMDVLLDRCGNCAYRYRLVRLISRS